MTAAHDADEAVDTSARHVERAGGTSLYARTWDDDEPDPVPAHPAPTEAMVEILPGDAPRAPARLLGALAPGWVSRLTRSVGHKPLTRKPWIGDEVTVVRVDLRHTRAGVAAVGLWVGGKFDQAWRWEVCASPSCARTREAHPVDIPTRIGSRELTALAKEGPA